MHFWNLLNMLIIVDGMQNLRWIWVDHEARWPLTCDNVRYSRLALHKNSVISMVKITTWNRRITVGVATCKMDLSLDQRSQNIAIWSRGLQRTSPHGSSCLKGGRHVPSVPHPLEKCFFSRRKTPIRRATPEVSRQCRRAEYMKLRCLLSWIIRYKQYGTWSSSPKDMDINEIVYLSRTCVLTS